MVVDFVEGCWQSNNQGVSHSIHTTIHSVLRFSCALFNYFCCGCGGLRVWSGACDVQKFYEDIPNLGSLAEGEE